MNRARLRALLARVVEERGWSQRQLAKALGVDPATVSHLLRERQGQLTRATYQGLALLLERDQGGLNELAHAILSPVAGAAHWNYTLWLQRSLAKFGFAGLVTFYGGGRRPRAPVPSFEERRAGAIQLAVLKELLAHPKHGELLWSFAVRLAARGFGHESALRKASMNRSIDRLKESLHPRALLAILRVIEPLAFAEQTFDVEYSWQELDSRPKPRLRAYLTAAIGRERELLDRPSDLSRFERASTRLDKDGLADRMMSRQLASLGAL